MEAAPGGAGRMIALVDRIALAAADAAALVGAGLLAVRPPRSAGIHLALVALAVLLLTQWGLGWAAR